MLRWGRWEPNMRAVSMYWGALAALAWGGGPAFADNVATAVNVETHAAAEQPGATRVLAPAAISLGGDERAHAADDRRSEIGFGQKAGAGRQLPGPRSLFAGADQQSDVWPARVDAMGERDSVHVARHDHVEHDGTHVVATLQDRERLRGIRTLQHGEAALLEVVGDDQARELLVLDHQDNAACLLRGTRPHLRNYDARDRVDTLKSLFAAGAQADWRRHGGGATSAQRQRRPERRRARSSTCRRHAGRL